MKKEIEEILDCEEKEQLQDEMYDVICNGGNYDDVEDSLLGYGLEMDYLEDLLF